MRIFCIKKYCSKRIFNSKLFKNYLLKKFNRKFNTNIEYQTEIKDFKL